jgi:signal transduction histidine kinase
MRHITFSVLLILTLHSALGAIYYIWGATFAEDYQFKAFNRLLDHNLQSARETFRAKPQQQWQNLAYQLQTETTTGVNIFQITSEAVPQSVLQQLKDPINADGFIDPETPYIYYPLGDSHILEIGPVQYERWLFYISEWMLILASVMIGLLALFTLFRYQNRCLAQAQQLLHIDSSHVRYPLTLSKLSDAIRDTFDSFDDETREYKERLLNQQDLLHGVAHEFRSPMARIQFALDLLEHSEVSQQKILKNQIVQNLDELDNLVKELLSYSRFRTQQVPLNIDKVNIGKMVEECFAELKDFYSKIAYELTIDINPEIEVDSNLFKRALKNVIRNGARYASTKLVIDIDSFHGHTRIMVEDDGPGIPPGKADRIFEPFTRLDASRSRDSGGNGLGLAIVKAILDKHHATITVGSSKLGGAAFTILLPST